MILRNSIFGLILASAALFGQVNGPKTPLIDEGVMLNGPKNLPAQDLLNMKGSDRPSPLKEVTIEQRLNSQIPLDATFRDETGAEVHLGQYFGKKPVVLA